MRTDLKPLSRLVMLSVLTLPLVGFGPRGCGPFGPKPCEGLDLEACKANPACEPVFDKTLAERADCADVERCTYAGCREKAACPAVACQMWCENGFEQDANGCDICKCKPAPVRPCASDADCRPGERCLPDQSDPCFTAPVRCMKPVRLVCQPEPTPCPEVMCDLWCPSGFQKDANGCDICVCNPPKNPECLSDADCAAGETCQPDPSDPCNGPTVECIKAGRRICLPAPTPCPRFLCDLWCPNGFQKDANGCDTCICNPPKNSECLSDADCAAGETCQPDPTDPCNGATVDCFRAGRHICLPAPAPGCSGLDEASCLKRSDCHAVFEPMKCPPGSACPAVMVFARCE